MARRKKKVSTQSKLQKILQEILRKDLVFCKNVRSLDWLRGNKGRNLEIDIVVKDKSGNLLLLIEYDGIQHTKPVRRFGGKRALKGIQERDALKRELLRAHKEKYIAFVTFTFEDDISVQSVFDKLLLNEDFDKNKHNLLELV